MLSLCAVTGDGSRASTRIEAVPSCLSWLGESGRIEAVYSDTDTVRVRGTTLGLHIAAAVPQLTPFSGTYLYRDPVDGSYVYTSYETGRRYRITVLAGTVAVEGDQALGVAARSVTVSAVGGASHWEIAIEEYDAGRAPYRLARSFDQARQDAGRRSPPSRAGSRRGAASGPPRPNTPPTCCGPQPSAPPGSSPGPPC